MKYLLIVILLLSTAYGQGDFPDGWWDAMKSEKNTPSDTVKYYNYKVWGSVLIDSLPPIKPPKEYFVVAFPKYWDEYTASLKKEFDDELKSEMFVASLRTKKYSVEDVGDKVWIEFMERGYPICIPIKKRKPTLEGFIEYLRRHK